jgi:hypothetical protein
MSNSLAAAKRRRAGEQPPMPPPTPSPSQQTQQNRMTLPQVLALLDSRLVKLETQTSSVMPAIPEEVADASKVSINEYISEMDAKFGMLVEEITNLKDIVLKLQTYTMDVNKKLLEEKNQSDIPPPE